MCLYSCQNYRAVAMIVMTDGQDHCCNTDSYLTTGYPSIDVRGPGVTSTIGTVGEGVYTHVTVT